LFYFFRWFENSYCVCLISCQFDLFLWHMREWIGSFRLVVYQKPLFCLYMSYWLFWLSFLSCSFFCKTSFRWLSSVCRYFLSEMVKALLYKWVDCWLFLCWVMVRLCMQVSICVLVFCTLDGLRYRQLF